MPKPTSAAKKTPIRVVFVTLDHHVSGSVDRARAPLRRSLPGLDLSIHAATDWSADPEALETCRAAVAEGDIIIVSMLFMEEHIRPIMPALEARRDSCDAMICCMSATEVVRLTRLGQFTMNGQQSGLVEILKKLRGKSDKRFHTAGARQMAMLRRLPKILRFIPGTAQDLRAYFLTLQYWLAGSDQNIANMVRFLVNRYADGPRAGLKGTLKAAMPADYPDVGLYHPRLKKRIVSSVKELPKAPRYSKGTVGLLVMRSYVLAGNSAHYDGVVNALEARGLRVIPAFASGLDSRPAIDQFFMKKGKSTVDAVVSLTGFSLVGGPAYNDSEAAADILAELDVPYLAAHAVEFQTLEEWSQSSNGLMPVEATMMVAIPELDGATGPSIFGGRSSTAEGVASRDMTSDPERASMLAARVERLVALRSTPAAERKVAMVLFNFPPNAGAVGTAAFLSVFASLHNALKALKADGYTVDVPETVDELRDALLKGNAQKHGTVANVHDRVSVEDHVRREPWLAEIEEQWGPAPGKHQSDGASIFVLGAQFGNVFVGLQPAFGYEGDPMRLLFEKGFSPTHAFAAFYRYLREEFSADAVVHFGTHGALEFMPGKQTALSSECWPDRLIGDLPNLYLYAANNPSEGAIAKRRAAATLVSYLTPPVGKAGLYRGLIDLKSSLERWRSLPPEETAERDSLAEILQAQAAELDLAEAEPAWDDAAPQQIDKLWQAVLEMEYALIPHGLHVMGEPPSEAERADMLISAAEAAHGAPLNEDAIAMLAEGADAEAALDASGLEKTEESRALFKQITDINTLLGEDHELPGLLHALDGGYIRPAPGGDLLRTPDILPTGRNVHGFDPFRIPSAYAMTDGAAQAQTLIDKAVADSGKLPESVALVLWGTDNLKTEGVPIAQAMALIGATPRFDSFGRLCGAQLVPLEELGRPRIDVVITLSGIFRDLMPLQTRLLAEACYLAAAADEPLEQNFVRAHSLKYQEAHGCDLETAALRVYSNADGAYGSNVNLLVDDGAWEQEDELAETYMKRKCFAYGLNGKPAQQSELLQTMLGDVDLAYQNLESVELGVTTIDHYFDTLGGISRAIGRTREDKVPVYIGDQTRGDGKVRTLEEQVALETRTRTLNPKWYEGMLKHGHEGVRQIEAQITNTMGWSATTGHVAPWVYQQITQTFLLDPEMSARLAELNPTASARMANRLLEAHEREYWTPDDAVLEALREAGEELEDRLEGIGVEAAA